MASIKSKIKARLQRFINNNPILGKILASFMGLIEVATLMVLKYIHDHISKNFKIRFIETFFKKRWGSKVVPLNVNIPAETKFLPTEEIYEIVSRSKVFGIGECHCRTTYKRCDRPTHTCMLLGGITTGRSMREIPYRTSEFTKVSKEEILDVLHESDEKGLVHQIIYFPTPEYYYVICNCCTCCCEVIHDYKRFLSPNIIASDFIQQRDTKRCINCGSCVERCPFGARKIIDGKLNVLQEKCFGCGMCIRKCPENAIKLVKRSP
ncbi:MAG: ATP-binding protein [Candidatus Hodarchaeota archaeon]